MKYDSEVYIEAIAELRKAADAADQADAMLRDVRCRGCEEVEIGRDWVGARIAAIKLEAMAKSLEAATCDDCGALLTEHGAECFPRPICVQVEYIHPPIPTRIDWLAYEDGKEEQQIYGYGATREEAVSALFERIADAA